MYKSSFNENDDEIVVEGVRNYKRIICIYTAFFIFVTVASFGMVIVVLPCLLLSFIIILKKWKLYVTRTDIHYNAGYGYLIIPFSEISQISVIPGTNTIHINKKNASVYATSNSVTITNILKISDVINCQEFVAAVKGEMTRSQQPVQ